MPIAAKSGDRITAVDPHLIQPPGPTAPILVPHPFNGVINEGMSEDVEIDGRPAAVQGSKASNIPVHVPIGGTFVSPPNNRGEITSGSGTVTINGRPAARGGDQARTCQDAPGAPGVVVAVGTVDIG